MTASPTRVVVELPEGAGGTAVEALAVRLRRLWILDEVRQGRMTRARAARELGIGLDELLSVAEAHGIALFDLDVEEFEQELASLG